MTGTVRCDCNYCRLGISHTASDAEVWTALEATPGFNEGMERARADYAAGRFSRFIHGESGEIETLGEGIRVVPKP